MIRFDTTVFDTLKNTYLNGSLIQSSIHRQIISIILPINQSRAGVPTANAILTEDGFNIITEDGQTIILE